jgi:acyl dehydratase
MRTSIDYHKLEVGDPLPPLTKDPISKIQLVRYSGASGDFNPLHTDDACAREAGIKGVIAHGPLIMGFVGQAICRWVPNRHLNFFKVRFMGMTFPGDIITVKATVTEKKYEGDHLKVVFDTVALDQNGETKLLGQFEICITT